jgi:hypothetical protein
VVVVVVVVVVPEELELLDESSFFAQEIMVRLKQEISKICKIFFIFSSILKLKSYWLVYVGYPSLYHHLENYSRIMMSGRL